MNGDCCDRVYIADTSINQSHTYETVPSQLCYFPQPDLLSCGHPLLNHENNPLQFITDIPECVLIKILTPLITERLRCQAFHKPKHSLNFLLLRYLQLPTCQQIHLAQEGLHSYLLLLAHKNRPGAGLMSLLTRLMLASYW